MRLLIALISAIIVISAKTTVKASNIECRIYSDTYKEYLYAKYKFLGLGSFRPVYLWRENNKNGLRLSASSSSLSTTSGRVRFSDDDRSGIWQFESAASDSQIPNAFYIRNEKYSDEYLRASDWYQELVYKKNRAVYTAEKTDQDREWFMWVLRRVAGKSNLYHIWNVKLGVPIYSRQYYSVQNERYNNPVKLVSLYNHPQPVSENFEWLLKCRDNRTPHLVPI